MSCTDKLKAWWNPPDRKYGVPAPLFVVPAAYVNKQAMEFPQGHFLPPCIIPPPEVVFSGLTLIINGTSVEITRADIGIVYAGIYAVSGGALVANITQANTANASHKFKVQIRNNGSVTVLSPAITLSAGSMVTNDSGTIAYTGGATGPAYVNGTELLTTGVELGSLPPGSTATLTIATLTIDSAKLVNNSVRLSAPGVFDATPEDNYHSFAVSVS